MNREVQNYLCFHVSSNLCFIFLYHLKIKKCCIILIKILQVTKIMFGSSMQLFISYSRNKDSNKKKIDKLSIALQPHELIIKRALENEHER